MSRHLRSQLRKHGRQIGIKPSQLRKRAITLLGLVTKRPTLTVVLLRFPHAENIERLIVDLACVLTYEHERIKNARPAGHIVPHFFNLGIVTEILPRERAPPRSRFLCLLPVGKRVR